MGRSKYLMPVYAALEDSGQHDLAVQWNDENKDFYHPVAETSILNIIGTDEAPKAEIILDIEQITNTILEEIEYVQEFTQQLMEPL